MRVFLFFLAFIPVGIQTSGQTSIQIILTSKANHAVDKVDVFDLSQTEVFKVPYKDSLSFSFRKDNIDCYNIRYHANGKTFNKQVWLNNGNIKIKAHLDAEALVIDTVLHSPIYYDHLKLMPHYAALYKEKDTAAIGAMLLEGYTENLDNPYSYVFGDLYIRLYQNSKPDLLKLKMLTDKQGDRFKWFMLYQLVPERLTSLLNTDKVALTMYSFINTQNKQTKLPAISSQYAILDFWFLACPPCVRDHQKIAKKLALLQSRKATVISISIDKEFKKWKAYLAKHKYQWANYLETRAKKNDGGI